MRVLSRHTIFDACGREPDERIAFFTSLCPLQDGTLLAGFQLGRSKHGPRSTVRLCRSQDGGQSWRELACRFETMRGGVPGSLAGAEMVEVEPGRILLFSTWFDRSLPDRPLFNPVTEGILRSQQLVAESLDEGTTWSPWRELSTGALTGCATTGPAIAWPDGTVLYAFESFKEYDDPRPAPHASWLLVSRDGGRSFGAPWRVAQDPAGQTYYWDQRLCPQPEPGRFVALFWTHDRALRRDLNVHQLHGALDEHPQGAPTLPTVTSLPGQIAAPLWLDEQRRLAFVVDRERPSTMTLWQSRDCGATWPAEFSLRIYQHDEQAVLSQGRDNVDYAQFWEDMGKWSFGHPAICRLDAQRALVAWYAGTPKEMSIHCAQVELDP